MYEPVAEFTTEALAVVAYVLGTITLSLLGFAAEYNGLREFLGGNQVLAGWFALMGVVALAFAVNLGREKLLPRITAAD